MSRVSLLDLKTIFKSLFFILTAVVLSRLLSALTSFMIAKILQPSSYGIYMTLSLLPAYAALASLGVVETLIKQVPFYLGKGDTRSAQRTEGSVLGWLIVSGAIIILLSLFINLHSFIGIEQKISILIRIMIIVCGVNLSSAFFYNRFIAHQSFKWLSMLEISRAIGTFLFVVALGKVFGLYGAIFGFLACECVIFVLSATISIRVCGAVIPLFNARMIWNNIKIGLPITAFWWIFLLQTSIDRLLSISLLGKEQTGYYSLGVVFVSTIILIPQVVGRVLYPKMNERLGTDLNEAWIEDVVILPTRILILILVFVIACVMFLSPWLYSTILPKYRPGLLAGQILLLGSYFRISITNGANFLIAKSKQKLILSMVLISVSSGILCVYILIGLGYGIVGIAISTSISGALLSLLVWWAVFRNMGFCMQRKMKEIWHLFLPFCLLLLIIGLSHLIFPRMLTHADVGSMIQGGFVLAFMVFVIIAINPLRKDLKNAFSYFMAGIQKAKSAKSLHALTGDSG